MQRAGNVYMDRRPHLLLASRSFLGDGRTCDVATTTKTTSRLSDRYLPETIEHDVTHTRRPVRQNRPVSTSRRPPGPLTSDEAQPLRSPLQITARRTICSVSGPKKTTNNSIAFYRTSAFASMRSAMSLYHFSPSVQCRYCVDTFV